MRTETHSMPEVGLGASSTATQRRRVKTMRHIAAAWVSQGFLGVALQPGQR